MYVREVKKQKISITRKVLIEIQQASILFKDLFGFFVICTFIVINIHMQGFLSYFVILISIDI